MIRSIRAVSIVEACTALAAGFLIIRVALALVGERQLLRLILAESTGSAPAREYLRRVLTLEGLWIGVAVLGAAAARQLWLLRRRGAYASASLTLLYVAVMVAQAGGSLGLPPLRLHYAAIAAFRVLMSGALLTKPALAILR